MDMGIVRTGPANKQNHHITARVRLVYFQISEDINWTPCFKRCKHARLRVPLDYQRSDGPRAELALQLLPTTDLANYAGPIMLNSGFPGGSGTSFVKYGNQFVKLLGPLFDLLGFDPRAALPPANCFTSAFQSKIQNLQHG